MRLVSTWSLSVLLAGCGLVGPMGTKQLEQACTVNTAHTGAADDCSSGLFCVAGTTCGQAGAPASACNGQCKQSCVTSGDCPAGCSCSGRTPPEWGARSYCEGPGC
jgi:hypothetical protein